MRIWLIVLVVTAAITAEPQQPNPSQASRQRSQESERQMKTGTFAVISDEYGTLFIDGSEAAKIVPDKVVLLKLVVGQHFVDLRDDQARKLWDKLIVIPDGSQVAEKIQLRAAVVSGGASKAGNQDPGRETSSNSAPAGNQLGREPLSCAELRVLFRLADAAKVCSDVGALEDTKARLAQVRSKIQGDSDKCRQAGEHCDYNALADEYYQTGSYDVALAYVNQGIQRGSPPFNAYAIPVMSYLTLGYSYSIRARIDLALLDGPQSLKDFAAAFESFGKARELATVSSSYPFKKQSLEALQGMAFMEPSFHLCRAIVLVHLDRPKTPVWTSTHSPNTKHLNILRIETWTQSES